MGKQGRGIVGRIGSLYRIPTRYIVHSGRLNDTPPAKRHARAFGNTSNSKHLLSSSLPVGSIVVHSDDIILFMKGPKKVFRVEKTLFFDSDLVSAAAGPKKFQLLPNT